MDTLFDCNNYWAAALNFIRNNFTDNFIFPSFLIFFCFLSNTSFSFSPILFHVFHFFVLFAFVFPFLSTCNLWYAKTVNCVKPQNFNGHTLYFGLQSYHLCNKWTLHVSTQKTRYTVYFEQRIYYRVCRLPHLWYYVKYGSR